MSEKMAKNLHEDAYVNRHYTLQIIHMGPHMHLQMNFMNDLLMNLFFLPSYDI